MSRNKNPFGSGYFGTWIEDEFGLPAYHYTCDQLTDPKAITPMSETWRSNTDHMHQVGNDRFVGVASNYGYIQIRQDEGSPKYLNDYDPDSHQYGGGFGYLTDGSVTLSTFYSGAAEVFDRIFGIGYYQKTVQGHGLTVEQTLFAPFGDDPVLISQVTIRNNRDNPVDLRWVEYWGCQLYQFSYKAFMMSLAPPPMSRPAPEFRRRFAKRFEHNFSVIGKKQGLLDQQQFSGPDPDDEEKWRLINLYLGSPAGKALTGGPVEFPVEEAVLEDTSPPSVFLVSLDAPFDDYTTNASLFFGAGGVQAPEKLQQKLSELPSEPETSQGFFLERQLNLGAGEHQTLYFAFGYLPEGAQLDNLIAKYGENPSALLAESSEHWVQQQIHFSVGDEPWVSREVMWHNYYLRGNLTFDSFFNEHILSQGHVYQYLLGFQGAARDPLQHALPFIYNEPQIVKSILKYTVKTVTPEGRIPYGITGSGMYMPAPFQPSDQELWLLWLASEYVLATRDLAFLDEEVQTYPIFGPSAGRESIRTLLHRCYTHLVETTGTGKHGLLRLSNGDWNDEVVLGLQEGVEHLEDPKEAVQRQGESVLNAAMASYVLDIYSRLLRCAGDTASAMKIQKLAQSQREGVHQQWTGSWFKRAWLTEELGWIGLNEMWLEPQPWAIIGGAADAFQSEKLLKSIDKLVRKPSKLGAMLLSKPLKERTSAPGIGTNAGIWPSINGTLIWALARVNGELAWDEWKRNSLALHAETYPEIWYGIWSGPDTYNSELADTPGQTGLEFLGVKYTDFPVMNMHPHAWPLYTTSKLIGVEFTCEGIDISPTLPKEEYRFASALLDFERTPKGYSGKYAPKEPGTWRITINLSQEERDRITKLEINGKEEKLIWEGTRLVITGSSSPDNPLKWVVAF
ncbi:MAG: GH36-type glycosyl hydrolase domain-containing protein [Promethearchaeota archaeon]